MTDTERENMEARARAWLNGHFNSTYDDFDIRELTSAFVDIATEAHREGMEEAAKVAGKWRGTTAGLEIAAAIREKIKDA